MVISELKGKKIAILGFGKEGRATWDFLRTRGIDAVICDQSPHVATPSPSLAILGEGYLDRLQEFDIIFRSPGIHRLNKKILAAEASGAVIYSQTKLFFDLCPAPIVGITGTKGKGTTAMLCWQMLKAAGIDAHLAGNIGTPPLRIIDDVEEKSVVVLELSSFQLQDLHKSPHVAVVTNLTVEHQDYHATPLEYRQAKSNIILYQRRQDFAVLNADNEHSKRLAPLTLGLKRWFSTTAVCEPGAYFLEDSLYLNFTGTAQKICSVRDVKLIGRHNLENILAAAAAAACMGVSARFIRKVATKSKGQEHHRLEFIGSADGVAFYNDSAGTVPETAIAALDAFDQTKVLIAGGSDKKSDYAPLIDKILSSGVIAVILMGVTGRKIAAMLKKAGYKGAIEENIPDMPAAINAARKHAKPGSVVLFSPASASFGMFRDYVDRGDQFTACVRSLAKLP